MYRDPERLRKHVVKVRFSAEEDRLLEALCDFTGEQKAAMVRDLVLEHARRMLLGDKSGRAPQGFEVPNEGRLCA